MRCSGCLSALLAGALAFAGVCEAAARPMNPDQPVSEARARVVLIVIGQTLSTAGLEEALGPQLKAMFEMRFATAEQFDPGALFQIRKTPEVDLHVWIDATRPEVVRLYFSNREGTRFLVRRLELSRQMDEMDREALAQAIQWSLQALTRGSRDTLTREQAESLVKGDAPVAEPPKVTSDAKRWQTEHVLPPRPSREAGWEPEVASLYRATLHSAELLALHGPAVRIGLDRVAGEVSYGLGIGAQYQLPQRYSDPRVAVGVRAAAWRAEARVVGLGLLQAVDLGMRIGAGVDTTWLSPEAVDLVRFEAPEGDIHHTGLLSWGILGHVPITSHARIELDLGLDADLARVHYDIVTSAGRERLIERWWLHPSLGLGVEIFWPLASRRTVTGN